MLKLVCCFIALYVPVLAVSGNVLPETAFAGSAQSPKAPVQQKPDKPDPSPVKDLGVALQAGHMLADRSGDGLVDDLAMRMVLPEDPHHEEVVTAANLAARIGYETTALDPDDLVSHEWPDGFSKGEVSVLAIGRAAMRANGLSPGQGEIRVLPGEQPGQYGGLHIAGYDASGLMAAGDWFSARYPQIWEPDSDSLHTVSDSVHTHLMRRDLKPASTYSRSVVVDREQPGVRRLTLHVQAEDHGQFDRIAEYLASTDSGEKSGALRFEDVHLLEVILMVDDRQQRFRFRPKPGWDSSQPETQERRMDFDFTLSEFYGLAGIYDDTQNDMIPDDLQAYIAYHGSAAPQGLIRLAARIGLETAGMRFPLVRSVGEEEDPASHGFPILFGLQYPHIEMLRKEDRLRGTAPSGNQGAVRMVPEAFDGHPALVLDARNEAGLKAASDYMARRLPKLWRSEKGQMDLDDLENDIRRFLQGESAAGGVAAGLEKLQTWLERIDEEKIPESIDIELSAEEVPEGVQGVIQQMVQERFPGTETDVALYQTGFGAGEPVFSDSVTFDWEVERARKAVREQVLTQVGEGDEVELRLRLSEPPDIRDELKTELRRELLEHGVREEDMQVEVLSAYKQGYHWLTERMLPRMQEEQVGRMEIDYHHLQDNDEVRWQAVHAETRWLQELYPVDEVLARKLDIADSLITFHPVHSKDPIYRARIYDGQGGLVEQARFQPEYTVRPYFDRYPEYDSVRVATGLLQAHMNGHEVAAQRIPTDLELFWDYFQDEVYDRLTDYMMDVQQGDPAPGNAPFFDELRVDLTVSEPDHRIGIQEEVISSAEAVHNDIYWQTLALVGVIGNHYGVGSLDYAGRVLPYIYVRQGEEPSARIKLTGKQRTEPALVMRYRDQYDGVEKKRYVLPNLSTPEPKLRGLTLQQGVEGPAEVLFDVQTEVIHDQYERYTPQGTEQQIDRAFLSIERLRRMIDHLKELHERGVFTQSLGYDRIGELRFLLMAKEKTGKQDPQEWNNDQEYKGRNRDGDDRKENSEEKEHVYHLAALPRPQDPLDTDRPELRDPQFEYEGQQLVQWETPIGPEENLEILARLQAFPEIQVYHAGRSFLGKNIFAADLLPPEGASMRSHAKLTTLKPTVFLSGREHGNEVSSTSHILRLAEYIATEEEYRRYLDRVNLVIHPMKNPDGAGLAREMFEENPDFTLHAGYLGALGVNIRNQRGVQDPLYPEVKVRDRLREDWLPDIYLNLHGYPSHEWVQQFAGYSAWVMNRNVTSRDWWAPRGWFLPGYSWIEDEQAPDFETASHTVLDSLTASVRALPDVQAMNEQMYDRYRKYRSHSEGFTEHYVNDVLVNASLRGRDMPAGVHRHHPRVTWFSQTTEAPDETADGDWLQLVSSAGVAHTTAVLRYLYEGEHRVDRQVEQDGRQFIRRAVRERPVMPPDRY